MNDWIHTRRGVTLVEGTLPSLATAVKELTIEIRKLNNHNEAQNERSKDLHGPGSSPNPKGLDPRAGSSSTGESRAQDT